MVNCLWTSLQNEIQVGLWREHLHPKYSLYIEVLEAAELIEIIESVSKAKSGSKNHKAPDNQPSSGGNHKGNDNPPRTGYSSKHSKGFKPSNGSRSGSHFNGKDSRPQPGPSGSSLNNWNKSKPPNKRPELSEKEKGAMED